MTASVLTPAGMGAVAVIRLCGADALSVLRSVFVPKRGPFPNPWPPDGLVYGCFVDPQHDHETIDDGIVAVRPDHRGGHTVDFNVHAGLRVVQRMLLLLQQAGARVTTSPSGGDPQATVAEAEVLAALAGAKTKRAVRFLARQRLVLPAVLKEIADTCRDDHARSRAMLADLIDRSVAAQYLLDGATAVFVGPTNAGKSTLINRLFSAAQSLVSDKAGTTRDWVDVQVALGGVPMRVIDTAGIRDTADPLERESIRRSLSQLRDADIQVVVVDGSTDFPGLFFERLYAMIDARRSVIAVNKADLGQVWSPRDLPAQAHASVTTSGLTGQGLRDLSDAMLGVLAVSDVDSGLATLVSRRQRIRLSGLLSDASPDDMQRGLFEEISTEFSG
ncbi:MAG: GTPase [Phycisphaerae bacterium]